MDTYQVEIIEPRAKKLLDDMAEMELITVQQIEVEPRTGSIYRTEPLRNKRNAVMALAGSWEVMSENDFQEYLNEAKKAGGEIFDREISL